MTDTQQALLRQYEEAIRQASETVHLTSAKDLETFWDRHIMDAVTLAGLIPEETQNKLMRVVDVGSGNGVPGIILAILFPNWNIDLIDSNNKKASFLDTFLNSNSITNCKVICDRAEYVGRSHRRETYDYGFARALGKLPTALELCTPLLKKEATLIVPHGTSWPEELERSKKAIQALHLKFIESKPYKVINETFYCLSFLKQARVEDRFPRNVGIPEKRPL